MTHWIPYARRIDAADQGGKLVPELIIIHYTAGATLTSAIHTLTAPADPKVSAHFIIGPAGELVQCVATNKVAYHAGASEWMGKKSCNRFSIGIELVNPGYTRPGFAWPYGQVTKKHKAEKVTRDWFLYTKEQYACLRRLLADLEDLPVVGHDQVAPGRKIDPGPAFDWTQVET